MTDILHCVECEYKSDAANMPESDDLKILDHNCVCAQLKKKKIGLLKKEPCLQTLLTWVLKNHVPGRTRFCTGIYNCHIP